MQHLNILLGKVDKALICKESGTGDDILMYNGRKGATTEHELYELVAAIAKELGFEYCAYVMQIPVPISRPIVASFHNYPQGWYEHYLAHDYVAIDPTVRHALKTNRPILWSEQIFSSTPHLWRDAQSYGLRSGWVKSSRDGKGAIGFLTLACSTESLDENHLIANSAKMTWLADFAHEEMTKLLMPKLVPELRAKLTEREKQVLRWTAEGKTSYEIGKILMISETTVIFHVKNVLTKLGALNKMHAVAKAAAFGLFW